MLALARLQCRVSCREHSWEVAGCSVETPRWPLPGAVCCGFQRPCRCKVKTAVVPSDRLSALGEMADFEAVVDGRVGPA
eukprot:2493142-Alexandrium_andersonii.AAC.1